MAWLIASLRRLRGARLAALGVGALVLVTAFLAAAGPRRFETISADSIHAALADIPNADRIVALSRLDGGRQSVGRATPVDLAGVAEDGDDLRATFPAPLPALLGPTSIVIETPAFRAVSGPALAAEIRLRIMPGAADHIRLTAGRAPTGTVASAPDPLHSGSQTGGEPSTATIVRLEASIARTSAEKLGLGVGATVVMVPDVTLDSRSAGSAIAVTIVGIFEPVAATDPFWVDDTRVLAYTFHDYSSNVTFIQSTLLLAPEAMPGLVGTGESGTNGFLTWGPPPRVVTWRYPVDSSRLDPETLPAAVAALRRLETLYPNGNQTAAKGVSLDTRLLGRLVGLQGPWDAASAVLGVAAVGAAAVALAALGLVIALTADERRRFLVLQRERGASSVQSILAVVVEAAIVALPAALIGGLIAIATVAGRDDGGALGTALLIALVAVALDLWLMLPSILGPPRQPTRVVAAGGPARARRLILELVVVALAVAGALTLRDRGLSAAAAASAAGTTASPLAVPDASPPDPFLIVVPVLVGAAAALVAARLAPLPIAGLAALAARGRRLGPVLAARRAARAPGASRVLLIILAIATLGTFGSATIVHLGRSADLQAWHAVGAAVRVDAGADELAGTAVLPAEIDPHRLPGVTDAAAAHVQAVGLSSGGQRTLVAVDAAALRRVLAGTPIVDDVPASLVGGGSPAGTDEDPLPAVISTRGAGPYRLAVGDVVRISLSSRTVSFRVVAAIDRFPGIPGTASFIVVSWPQVDVVAPHRLQGATSLFLRTQPGPSAEAIAASVRPAAPGAAVSAQATEASRLAGQPVVGVLTGGVVALAAIALVYATLAVVAAFVLAASARALETAQLATLGLPGGAAGGMLLGEYGPPVVLATIAGVALGVGLFAFLAPGLGFGLIVGVVQTPAPALDPAQLALLVVVVAAILVVGVAVGAPAQRLAAGAAARRGIA